MLTITFIVSVVAFLAPVTIGVVLAYNRYPRSVKTLSRDIEFELMKKAILPQEEPVQTPVEPVTAPPVEAEGPAEVTYTFYDYDERYQPEKKFVGWDINEKMIALGADELPENHRYLFFPTIQTESSRSRMQFLHSNAIVIMYKMRPYLAEVEEDGNVDDNFLIAAMKANAKFLVQYQRDVDIQRQLDEAEAKRRRIIEFAKGKPEMLVLGDEQEHVED